MASHRPHTGAPTSGPKAGVAPGRLPRPPAGRHPCTPCPSCGSGRARGGCRGASPALSVPASRSAPCGYVRGAPREAATVRHRPDRPLPCRREPEETVRARLAACGAALRGRGGNRACGAGGPGDRRWQARPGGPAGTAAGSGRQGGRPRPLPAPQPSPPAPCPRARCAGVRLRHGEVVGWLRAGRHRSARRRGQAPEARTT